MISVALRKWLAGLAIVAAVGADVVISSATASPHLSRAADARASGHLNDPTTSSSAPPPACPRAVRRLGMIAVAARSRVELVDLATCRATVLRTNGTARVRYSADGRWLAYSGTVYGHLTAP